MYSYACQSSLSHVSIADSEVYREKWTEFLSTCQDSFAFMTLGFRVYLDPQRAIDTAGFFLRASNRQLFGKRFVKNGRALSGTVVMERKRQSRFAWGSPHFHMLVTTPAEREFSLGELQLAAEGAAKRLRFPFYDPLRPMGKKISGRTFVDVRSIGDIEGLARYLTKEVGSMDATSIGFFGLGGFVGLDAALR